MALQLRRQLERHEDVRCRNVLPGGPPCGQDDLPDGSAIGTVGSFLVAVHPGDRLHVAAALLGVTITPSFIILEARTERAK